jgi:hypothetical protein
LHDYSQEFVNFFFDKQLHGCACSLEPLLQLPLLSPTPKALQRLFSLLFFPSPVWINPKKKIAKSDKTSNVQNRIRRELMKLHAIDKEKPTKKFMGRKRKSTKEKGEKHHPVSLRWFWNTLVAGEDDRRRCRKKALLLGSLDRAHQKMKEPT